MGGGLYGSVVNEGRGGSMEGGGSSMEGGGSGRRFIGTVGSLLSSPRSHATD